MPFLNRLIQQEGYRLHTHFPGVPTSTPAIQGELFYGVKRVVPAFSFLDRQNKKIMRMFESDACAHVEKILAQSDPGLLKGGSSYSNIFTGGAEESHFCPGTIGLERPPETQQSVVPFTFDRIPRVEPDTHGRPVGTGSTIGGGRQYPGRDRKV